MSSSVSGFRVSSSERDSSGEITEKLGFSVVAAINVTSRFSTAGSSTSCWVLENRCTSSTKSTVLLAVTQVAARLIKDGSHLLDPGSDRGDLHELRVGLPGHDRRDGRLAGSRWVPEEHRHRLSKTNESRHAT